MGRKASSQQQGAAVSQVTECVDVWVGGSDAPQLSLHTHSGALQDVLCLVKSKLTRLRSRKNKGLNQADGGFNAADLSSFCIHSDSAKIIK